MQEFFVALIVMLATWVVLRKYLPATVRRRGAAMTARALRRVGLASAARWLEQDLPAAASCADGCGSCGNCATTPSPRSTHAQINGLQDDDVQHRAYAVHAAITPEALKRTIRRS